MPVALAVLCGKIMPVAPPGCPMLPFRISVCVTEQVCVCLAPFRPRYGLTAGLHL